MSSLAEFSNYYVLEILTSKHEIIGLPYKNIQKQPLQFFADEIQRTIGLLASIPLLAKASLLEIACCMYVRHWV